MIAQAYCAAQIPRFFLLACRTYVWRTLIDPWREGRLDWPWTP